jgi:hypothetical protein
MTSSPRLRQRIRAWLGVAAVLTAIGAIAVSDCGMAQTKATSLSFVGMNFVHRWSKEGQNEFTPAADTDLARWHDMVTVNVNDAVRNGDQLADLANRVLTKYQAHGKIVRTDSKPRTPQRPAEHLIVALLGNPGFLEAAFARLVLIEGAGVVAVYSHRIYGDNTAQPMGEWLERSGPSIEKALMQWDGVPSVSALKQLPQSK